MFWSFVFAYVGLLIWPGDALECYVCTRQETNEGKCTQTVQPCEPGKDRCLSEIRWGSTPYWAPSGEKQYYISKFCATKAKCEEDIQKHSRRCDKIWYNDWECAECCQGDRCNYYVTLGARSLSPSFQVILLAVCLILRLAVT